MGIKKVSRCIASILLALVIALNNMPIVHVLADDDGFEWVIEPQFDFASNFSDGLARVVKDGERCYIDKTGKIVIPFDTGYADDFLDGLALVGQGDYETMRYGFIDKTGELVIPYKYKSGDIQEVVDGDEIVGTFSDGLALVTRIDETLYCDGNDDPSLEHADSHPTEFSGYIDKTGKLVIPHQYIYAQPFSEGLALVSSDGYNYGFINTSGEVVIPFEFSTGEKMWGPRYYGMDGLYPYHVEVESFSNGLAKVYKDGKYGFIDKTGELVIPYQFSNASSFSEGIAIVSNGDKYGFIDKTGQLTCPYQFDESQLDLDQLYSGYFKEGLIRVKDKNTGNYGFADKTGNLVIPYKFSNENFGYGSHYANFTNGLLCVKIGEQFDFKNYRYGFIDKTGELAIPYYFDDLYSDTHFFDPIYFSEGLSAVSMNGKYGFIKKTGDDSSYTFLELISTGQLPQDEIDNITSCANTLVTNGEVTYIYELPNGKYYVVYDENGAFTGGVIVKTVHENGEKVYKAIDSSDTQYTEEYLNEFTKEENLSSNIVIKYNGDSSSKKNNSYLSALAEALENIDGLYVNDMAKSDIANYIETSLMNISITTVKTKDDVLDLKYKSVKSSIKRVLSLQEEFNKILEKNGITLNRQLKADIRIDSKNVDFEKGVAVHLEKDLMNIPPDITHVVLLLGDNSHSIKINTSTLKSIINKHGDFYITILKLGNGKYQIQYLDNKNNLLEELHGGVYFNLPADNNLSTISATYKGNTDNWGGRYDEFNKSIEFMTKYSGIYEVISNTVEITDISEFDETTQNAIKYMVSKEYFELQDGLFRPNDLLPRYDFSKALVKMFYALDRESQSDFSDVEKDSEYYPFVSSGVESDIIKGFEDNTFRGDKNLTNNEAVAFCARTLAEKTGYIYPENPEDYLTFKDSDLIPSWAKNDIALAVREGLIEPTDYFYGNEEISREASAKLLYNLFMLLNKAPTEVYQISESTDNTPFIIIGALGGLAILLGVGFSFYKKK